MNLDNKYFIKKELKEYVVDQLKLFQANSGGRVGSDEIYEGIAYWYNYIDTTFNNDNKEDYKKLYDDLYDILIDNYEEDYDIDEDEDNEKRNVL